jgi:hypothetical protein
MFYGYNSLEEAKKGWGKLLEVDKAEVKSINVCSDGKHCIGFLGGFYLYDDGSKDTGREVSTYRLRVGENVIAW